MARSNPFEPVGHIISERLKQSESPVPDLRDEPVEKWLGCCKHRESDEEAAERAYLTKLSLTMLGTNPWLSD